MADDADNAQPKSDLLLNSKIEARRAMAQSGTGTGECIECEELIPAARQKAVPGCERCVECQAEFEGGR